jgi:hypothetical protein
MSRTAAPKVPGQIAADEPETAEAPAAQVAALPAADGQEAPAAETVVVEKVQLDALLAQVAALSNKVRGMETAKQGSKFAVPAVELPDASTIDPDTLKTPVLTKQGWLVPETFGSNPNAPKAF